MHKKSKLLLAMALSAALAACANTSDNAATTNVPAVDNVSTPQIIQPQNLQTEQGDSTALTLEKIMADPDWLGRAPQSAFWSDDSRAIFYQRKREGSPVSDLWMASATEAGNGSTVALDALHLHSYEERVYNTDKSRSAWLFNGNVFVKDLTSGQVSQLTRDDASRRNLAFLTDGRLSYLVGNSFYAIDSQTGMTSLLASWKFEDAPQPVKAPEDFIAKEQLELIQFVQKERSDRQARFDHQQAIVAQNASATPKPFYLPSKHETVTASLSPDGKWVIVAEQEDKPSRDDSDIMPNYIGEDGRIKSERVRRRVADAKPQSHTLWLLDLTQHQASKLDYAVLPGYNEDVLADVKAENAKARGETYEVNRLPRDIGLIFDWYWNQSAIQWHSSAKQVAVMLEAWDNKDRWIATVDLASAQLESQHRLHDDAWINYRFNEFGWLKNSPTLYYLSEESGYSQLYLKPLEGTASALTKGQFEVGQLTLGAEDQFMYYRANVKHPGIYEVYRVNLASGESEALTDLNGMVDYVLSPDESHLLLTHSTLTQPEELYVKTVGAEKPAARITHTVSEAFSSINWQAPHIVPVPSSHTDKPIYSRVYFPKDYQQGEKRRAVIFNHGAGYLQNSHLGWSGYFREFMFHNMLVEKGYVVMDMDYRASAGYGRDWRTAIYRHMGKPETEDLVDGVNWLVDNANVDRERIGTYGGSYGGFMTFMALFTEPGLFKAGAALRPVTDWAHYNHPYTSNILNTPDVDAIAYRRSSPLYFAEGLQDRLLINAPMVDNNVFFVDVVRLVQRLIELEKVDFETAIYPVEPHGFRQPSSWLDEYRRIFKLFEDTL